MKVSQTITALAAAIEANTRARQELTAAAERTATPAELADESARATRARAGRQRPRTLHALIEQAARLLPCEHCGGRPGNACDGADGYHLARLAEARRRGLITAPEMDAILDAAGVITNGTVIRDGTR
jgi:hypothetical protein